MPNPHDLILERLVQAGLVYRHTTPNPLSPEPGESFDQWFRAVVPYAEPLIFGPSLIGSSATLLALAAQFQDWARHWGLVQFHTPHPEPLIARMMSLNAMLYGLNGYVIDLISTTYEILDHYQAQADIADETGEEPLPPTARPGVPAPPPTVTGRGPSFEELFRK